MVIHAQEGGTGGPCYRVNADESEPVRERIARFLRLRPAYVVEGCLVGGFAMGLRSARPNLTSAARFYAKPSISRPRSTRPMRQGTHRQECLG